jgi:hypothetical protein
LVSKWPIFLVQPTSGYEPSVARENIPTKLRITQSGTFKPVAQAFGAKNRSLVDGSEVLIENYAPKRQGRLMAVRRVIKSYSEALFAFVSCQIIRTRLTASANT